ncbi:adenylosuccinate lyase [uncultured Dokdonia sp.]|uniref:adenylosuccinate lyase n=1 Tax=uncultured Dokdonia sp. TaxID=575653 RepID=UPI00260AD529|nr:adenylosuccinate lyase [uncultured Dokdonia sp.]
MTYQELYDQLNYVNHSREKRAYYAQLVISTPELMPHILKILFKVNDPISNRAGWLLEFVCKTDLTILFPYLDTFTEKMHTVYQDSALRPVAKICEYLTLSYYKKKDPLTRKHIKSLHKERMTEAGFDWLITEQKVAVKAYTLTSLFLIGTEIDWIHPELKRIMEDDYHKGSAAYKARCRHMFEALKKFEKRT